MTVAALSPYTYYWGTGTQTTFSYPFEVERAEDFLAYHDDVLVTNYQLSGLGVETGGMCTFTFPPPSGVSIVLMRRLALDQETTYPAYSPFPAQAHEKTLDTLEMQIQQLAEVLERCAQLKRTIRPPWRNLVLPDPQPSTLLGWDALGEQWILYPPTVQQVIPDPISGIAFGKTQQTVRPAAGDWEVALPGLYPAGC